MSSWFRTPNWVLRMCAASTLAIFAFAPASAQPPTPEAPSPAPFREAPRPAAPMPTTPSAPAAPLPPAAGALPEPPASAAGRHRLFRRGSGPGPVRSRMRKLLHRGG